MLHAPNPCLQWKALSPRYKVFQASLSFTNLYKSEMSSVVSGYNNYTEVHYVMETLNTSFISWYLFYHFHFHNLQSKNVNFTL